MHLPDAANYDKKPFSQLWPSSQSGLYPYLAPVMSWRGPYTM